MIEAIVSIPKRARLDHGGQARPPEQEREVVQRKQAAQTQTHVLKVMHFARGLLDTSHLIEGEQHRDTDKQVEAEQALDHKGVDDAIYHLEISPRIVEAGVSGEQQRAHYQNPKTRDDLDAVEGRQLTHTHWMTELAALFSQESSLVEETPVTCRRERLPYLGPELAVGSLFLVYLGSEALA